MTNRTDAIFSQAITVTVYSNRGYMITICAVTHYISHIMSVPQIIYLWIWELRKWFFRSCGKMGHTQMFKISGCVSHPSNAVITLLTLKTQNGRGNTNQTPVGHTHDNLPPASLFGGNTSIYCPSRSLGDILPPDYCPSSLHVTGRNSIRY